MYSTCYHWALIFTHDDSQTLSEWLEASIVLFLSIQAFQLNRAGLKPWFCSWLAEYPWASYSVLLNLLFLLCKLKSVPFCWETEGEMWWWLSCPQHMEKQHSLSYLPISPQDTLVPKGSAFCVHHAQTADVTVSLWILGASSEGPRRVRVLQTSHHFWYSFCFKSYNDHKYVLSIKLWQIKPCQSQSQSLQPS
jgi:hypothetical protein